MSEELRGTFHKLDYIYREDWAHPGGGIRAVPGNAPRIRLPSDGKSETVLAPKGLGRNCYDAAWVKALKPYQRQALRIRNEIWDLSVPDDLDSWEDEDDTMGEEKEAAEAEADGQGPRSTAGRTVTNALHSARRTSRAMNSLKNCLSLKKKSVGGSCRTSYSAERSRWPRMSSYRAR